MPNFTKCKNLNLVGYILVTDSANEITQYIIVKTNIFTTMHIYTYTYILFNHIVTRAIKRKLTSIEANFILNF